MIMKSFKLSFVLILLLTILIGISSTGAVAQYDGGSSATCENVFDIIVRDELTREVTTTISITVNNILSNILNVGNSPSGRYDSRGYPIVEIDSDQALLPVVGQSEGYLTSDIILMLEDTDLEWGVKVNSDDMFLTDFPIYMFPPGSYYMTLCDARIFRVEIPEDYDPVTPAK